MYIADMSAYSYYLETPWEGVLAVGWLAAFHRFPVSRPWYKPWKATPWPGIDKLEWLAREHPVGQTRGRHQCPFCLFNGECARTGRLLGTAEIWVPRGPREYFAAPDLIVHYVRRHRYKPPDPFLAALDELDPATFARDLDREREELIEAQLAQKPE